MSYCICVTGPTAAGKSMLSKYLSNKLEMPYFSLGAYQRAHFKALGFNSPAEYHKALGLDVTYYGLWPSFIGEIINMGRGDGIIVDGVYSPGFMVQLSHALPKSRLSLLKITAPLHLRFCRFFKREQSKQFTFWRCLNEFYSLEIAKRRLGSKQMMRQPGLHLANDADPHSYFCKAERALSACGVMRATK